MARLSPTDRVLVRVPAWLGDLVAVEPALEALHRHVAARGALTLAGAPRLLALFDGRFPGAARVDASDAFKKIKADVERIKKLRALTKVPLEEKAFMALLADREESEKVAEKAQKDDADERKIKRDDYLDEVLRIATDYAKVMKSNA